MFFLSRILPRVIAIINNIAITKYILSLLQKPTTAVTKEIKINFLK